MTRSDSFDPSFAPAPSRPAGAPFPRWGWLLLWAAALAAAPAAARAQSDDSGLLPGDEGEWAQTPPDDDAQAAADEAYRKGYEAGLRDGRAEDDGEAGEAEPAAGPTVEEFQEKLSPYGTWTSLPTYGLVWQPTGMAAGWRPYLWGQWVWTRWGWTWVSDEPWGWGPYHYGRWVHHNGWYWVPGRVWGPAWVSWRWGGGVAGWCPLGWGGVAFDFGPAWVFVDSRHFLDPVRQHAVPHDGARDYWQRARALPIRRPGPRAGPMVQHVATETRRRINVLPVRDVAHPSGVTTESTFAGGRISVYRPRTRPIARPMGGGFTGGRPGGGAGPGGRPGAGEGGRNPDRPGDGKPPAVRPYFGGVPAQGIIERHRDRQPPGGAGAPAPSPKAGPAAGGHEGGPRVSPPAGGHGGGQPAAGPRASPPGNHGGPAPSPKARPVAKDRD